VSNRVHVHPGGDLIDHDLESDDCVCGPGMRPVRRADGSIEWIVTHHSLDGREHREAAQ